jgi:hypothetical protein
MALDEILKFIAERGHAIERKPLKRLATIRREETPA